MKREPIRPNGTSDDKSRKTYPNKNTEKYSKNPKFRYSSNTRCNVGNYEKGFQAELQAIDYLKSQNYTILKHRFLSPYGEIDILALKNQIIIAVEVKQRQYLEAARTCIGYHQKQRIENALLYFISQFPEYKEFSLRLDVVLLAENQRVHIENAWT